MSATPVALRNSPFWLGADGDHASYRTLVWKRWPTSGPPLAFDSKDDYDVLVACGAIDDESNIY